MSEHKGLRAKVEGRGRIVAVGAGVAAVIAVGFTGVSVADGERATVGSAQIKDGGVYSPDLHDNGVRSVDIRDKGVHNNDLADFVHRQINTTPLRASQLAVGSPVTVTHIGGPINDNYTDTGLSRTLPAGRYLVDLSGAFSSDTAATDPSVDVWPQLSLWLDHDGDGAFAWQTEGLISPNALMPTAPNRHITVSGQAVIRLLEETKVGVVAHGYASDQSAARSGDIQVVWATLTATPLR